MVITENTHSHIPSFPSLSISLTVAKGSLGAVSDTEGPRSHAEQRPRWTARGMGWACSLTQPALGTTAQLAEQPHADGQERAMRESVSRPGSHGHSHSHTAGSQVQEPPGQPLVEGESWEQWCSCCGRQLLGEENTLRMSDVQWPGR